LVGLKVGLEGEDDGKSVSLFLSLSLLFLSLFLSLLSWRGFVGELVGAALGSLNSWFISLPCRTATFFSWPGEACMFPFASDTLSF